MGPRSEVARYVSNVQCLTIIDDDVGKEFIGNK